MGGSMIILTGYNGFIGKAFAKRLDEDNIYRVEKDGVDLFLREYEDWDKVELIIHQGAISSTVETDLNKIHKYNVDFSIQLFEKAIEHQIPVKYASSASVYGKMLTGIINPLNYYAISKVIVDYWVQDHIDEFKLVQGFRYFNVYGEGENHKNDQASPVHKFSKQIEETGKLKLFEGSDKFSRDFICVDDVVDVVLNNDKPSGIYDLGTSNPVSFQHVAECVAKKYGGEIEYIPFPDHLKGKYQAYTCASMDWLKLNDLPYHFITVEDYLK
tara:strand:+ start:17 stop:829 length:813 start_codon:yes stop_codon:yes gene_type:complete